MIWTTLGSLSLSKRIRIDIVVNCGDDLTPDELDALGLLLQWVGRAARQWKHGYDDSKAAKPKPPRE